MKLQTRRALAFLALPLSAIALTGCFALSAPTPTTAGMPQALTRAVTLSPDGPAGLSVQAAADRWNAAARRELFAVAPPGAPADVYFSQRDGMSRQFWVPAHQAGTCLVYFDVAYARYALLWNDTVLAHELGHCLGYPDVSADSPTGYEGVMSYKNFSDPSHQARFWFQGDDREMLLRDGLGG